MKNLRKLFVMAVFFSLAGMLFAYAEEATAPGNVPVALSEAPAVVEKSTLENLQTAFDGESNANAQYLAFAQKADEEGWTKSASLFRAVARAEQVHLERHAKIIKELGGTPTAKIETPVVKGTADNFKMAMDGELYETITMYPEFLAKAEKDNIKDAADAFEDAGKAEGVHAKLFKHAVELFASGTLKKGQSMDLYVCPVCGNVVSEKDQFTICPICSTSRGKFIKVN